MSYIEVVQSYGHDERKLNVARFAADLRKALGGAPLPAKDCDTDVYRHARFALDGNEITLTSGWRRNEIDKVTVRCSPLNCKLDYNNTPRGDEYKLPEATVSAERPLQAIAADIKRRVIEPAKAPIAKRREYAATLAKQANDLASTCARLRERFPGLSVTLKNGATYSASLYHNTDAGPYLSGQVHADGSMSIDRLGSLSADQFERVMTALYNN